METPQQALTTADTIDKLLFPDGIAAVSQTPARLRMRLYNALARRGIRTVADVLKYSEKEIGYWRQFGPASVAELVRCLDAHGWHLAEADAGEDPPWTPEQHRAFQAEVRARMPSRRGAAPPEGLEEASWVGHQLDALSADDRVHPKNRLGGRYVDVPLVERRRSAWAWYRWGTAADAPWPKDGPGGFRFMAYPLPGSVELHLEGLNRLAHEELDR